jgi:L-alanine-DL-glutamate epimerase-like enolase superfamily enzyme
MKITDLSLTLFNWKSAEWKTPTSVFGGVSKLGIVTLTTDEGLEGHAFLGSSRQGADEFSVQLMKVLKPIVMGRDPLDHAAMWEQMWKQLRNVPSRAIGAVDIALWDLAGKIAGLPIYKLLGACREEVPAYASSALRPTTQDYVEEALHVKSLGWPAYKMHLHCIPDKDIEICRAVRKAVGDDYVLMLDASWGYTYEQALQVGLVLQELNYFWYEDPLAVDDIYNYVELKRHLHIPMMNTEYVPGGLYAMPQWVIHRATDILRGDVAVTGGITPMVRLCHVADVFRMKCELHHGSNSLNNAANLHVILSVNNSDY